MRLGLRTEASVRFERGCDPFGIDRAMLRFCELLAGSAGPGFAVVPGSIDVRGEVPGPLTGHCAVPRLNAVLGSDLDDAQIAGYLEPIGFETAPRGPRDLEVTVPTFRPDTTREIDVIEEVARHHGYGSLPRRTPRSTQVGALSDTQTARRRLRNVLSHTGAHEAWTPSLIAAGDHELMGLGGAEITVANPLNPDESVLRRSLLPGHVPCARIQPEQAASGRAALRGRKRLPRSRSERVRVGLEHRDPARTVVDEREVAGLLLAGPDDDATTASPLGK